MGNKKNKKNKQQSIAVDNKNAEQQKKEQATENECLKPNQEDICNKLAIEAQKLKNDSSSDNRLNSMVGQQNQVSLDQSKIIQESVANQQNQKSPLQSLLSKQQSLDMYLELKYQFSKKDSQIAELKNSDSMNLKKQNTQDSLATESKGQNRKQLSVLISVQDEEIPSLDLQPSPKCIKPVQIQILSYRTAIFMKLNTHFFKIKISNPNTNKPYQIQRRFSQFSDLYDQLFYNHPGYILYPFPDKTLDSFFKLKMGLAAEQNQICQLIQKRMKQLETFLNWLATHSQLRNSEEFAIFIEIQEKKFSQGTVRLNKYVTQYKQLQNSSYIASVISKGKQILTYFRQAETNTSQQTQALLLPEFKNIKNAQISEKIRIKKQAIKKLSSEIKILWASEKYFSQFNGIQTDIDILQKLCTKHVSGRNFCKSISFFLNAQILDQLKQLTKQIQEAQKSLIHIAEIIQGIVQSKRQLNLQKKAKLQRRLERASKNFEYDWPSFYQKCQKSQNVIMRSLEEQWKQFKINMKKVWKSKH